MSACCPDKSTGCNTDLDSSVTQAHHHDHAHGHSHGHAITGEALGQDTCAPGCCGTSAMEPLLGLLPNEAELTAAELAAPARSELSRIRIAQMDCPTEEALLRKRLGSLTQVRSLQFNLMQRVLTVAHSKGALPVVEAAIRDLGMTPESVSADAPKLTQPKSPPWQLIASGLLAISAEAVHWANGVDWFIAALALGSIALCGLCTYKKGWIALKNRELNINALMTIAVTGAVLIGQWPEAAMVMFLFTVAEIIEAKSLDRARNAIRSLLELAPELASVQQEDGSWAEVPPKSVTLNSVVRVKPGERIALDGVLLSGHSYVDQAPITGESIPQEKTPGDSVFAGTINTSGAFEYRVTAVAGNTTLARIIHAVEEAQGARAPTQRFVDRFAKIYTPTVFAIALAVASLPPLLLDGIWFDWIYKALVLLVIACPCALVISTPVTIVSGLAAAARHGILIKGGVYLEQGRHLKWLALDKTGTITQGKPVQTDFELLDPRGGNAMTLAASLSAQSDHPVSQAISNSNLARQQAKQVVEQFSALPGRGVKGSILGREYHFGNHRLIHELGLCSPQLEARLTALEKAGKSIVLLADSDGVLALFGVADAVKASSREAVDELHALGVKTLMLSGDNPHTVSAIGKEVGIDEARGNQLPEDKVAAIVAMQGTSASVGMVGDGINDAPALAKSDIGFAMGAAGSDTAIETADVALMDDDLRKIPTFIQLSRRTAAILKQNIALALGIKAVFLTLTLLGMGSMWMAVFADVGASLLVVGNGLRLLRH